VVAVGDFDPAAVEALIREHFSGLAARPPVERLPAAIPGHDETRVVSLSDPAAAQGHGYGQSRGHGGSYSRHGGFGRPGYSGGHGRSYGRHGGSGRGFGYGGGHRRSSGGHGGYGGQGH